MERNIVKTEGAPAPIGPYNQAIFAGDMLFLSGQIALKPGTNDLNNASIEEETHQVMKNLEAVLKEAGLNFSNVIKTTIYLSDMSLFLPVNETYGSYFQSNCPARETVAVKGLPRNVNVEISMIATR